MTVVRSWRVPAMLAAGLLSLALLPANARAEATPAGAATPAGSPGRHQPSGLTVLPPLDRQPEPMPETLGNALADAYRMAEQNPDDFGYPWADRATNRVVVANVTPKGARLSAAVAALRAGPGPQSKPGITRASRSADRSFAVLERIKDSAIELRRSKLPDADAIVETSPDPAGNRVIITLTRLSDALMVELARTYGTEAIAIRVDPTYRAAVPYGRNNDETPFHGGAQWAPSPEPFANMDGCTTGFPWYTGDGYGMVSAGHCTNTAGNPVNTPIATMGRTTAYDTYTDESVLINGNYFGDIVLLEIAAGRTVAPEIYRGGPGSVTTAQIDSMWSRPAEPGDQYCTGGRITGELCGWVIVDTHINNATWHNVNKGVKTQGQCSWFGDSGAPEYTVLGNGRVVAKGILDGGNEVQQGSIALPCFDYSTDIHTANAYLPGVLAAYNVNPPPPAQQPWLYYQNRQIQSTYSNLCMVVQGGDDGSQAFMHECSIPYGDQLWTMVPANGGGVQFVNANSGKCLVTPYWADYRVTQSYCADYPDQKWNLSDPNGAVILLVNQYTGQCVAAPSWSSYDAVGVPCGPNADQYFRQR